jgi:hypothetical protein
LMMSWRFLALGRVWLGACAVAGLVAGCDDRPATSDDRDLTCTADDDCSSLGSGFVCDAGHCREDVEAPLGGSGNSGAPGSSGAPGNSGASAGAGGAAEPSLSACAANRDSSPSLPEPTELDPDLVARAAAVVGSCMPDDGVARNADHIWGEHLGVPLFHHRLGTQVECLANAACGCAAVELCLGVTRGPAPDAECATQCDGDVLSGCDEGEVFTIDCGSLGQSCDESLNCVSEPPQPCAGGEQPTCTAEGEVQYCTRGILRKTPCQSVGFSCVNGECVGEGAACDSFASASRVELVGTGCAGNTLEACLGGHSTSVDCATQGPGFSCQSLEGTFFCGLAADCVPPTSSGSAMPPASCDGNVLTFCSAGRIEQLDCTTLGFTGCEIDTSLARYGCVPGVVLQ